MSNPLTLRERLVRVVLGAFFVLVAFAVGLTGHASTEPTVLAWGALVLAVAAFGSAVIGGCRPLTRVGLDADWSLALLAGRLFVGWEFLYAGWLKATGGWYTHAAGTAEVRGVLNGAITQSHATAQDPFPAVPHWFAWLAANVLADHAQLIGYLVVTAEVLVGTCLIIGLGTRLAALFAVSLNTLFMFAGALGGGLNPEMVIPGLIVLLDPARAIHGLSIDRHVLPWLGALRRRSRISGLRGHATAH